LVEAGGKADRATKGALGDLPPLPAPEPSLAFANEQNPNRTAPKHLRRVRHVQRTTPGVSLQMTIINGN
jgi:hypothetical protein